MRQPWLMLEKIPKTCPQYIHTLFTTCHLYIVLECGGSPFCSASHFLHISRLVNKPGVPNSASQILRGIDCDRTVSPHVLACQACATGAKGSEGTFYSNFHLG